MQSNSSVFEYSILTLSLCLGAMSTALASPLYAIYMQQWHISTTHIGYAFISYMCGVVFTLLFLNGLIAKVGFKKTTIFGMGISILGLLYSALAPDIVHLIAARFLIGISSGLLCTATLVGLARTYPFAQKQHADKVSALLTVTGFGLGPLVGGLIADHSQQPLVMPYLVITVFSVFTLIGCFFLTDTAVKSQQLQKFRLWNAPQQPLNKILFVASGLTAMCCFAGFSLYSALAGNFIAELPIASSATLVGSAIAIILFISAITQMLTKKMDEFHSMKISLLLLSLACGMLFMAQASHSNMGLALSVLFIGIGHGLGAAPAYYFAAKISAQEGKSSIFSSFLLIGYQGTIWPVLLCSVLIDHFGILTAIASFSCLIMICAILIFRMLTPQLKQTFREAD